MAREPGRPGIFAFYESLSRNKGCVDFLGLKYFLIRITNVIQLLVIRVTTSDDVKKWVCPSDIHERWLVPQCKPVFRVVKLLHDLGDVYTGLKLCVTSVTALVK